MRLSALLLMLVFVCGCYALVALPKYRAHYVLSLVEVEVPDGFANSDAEPAVGSSSFEDDWVLVDWVPTSKHLSFSLTNRSASAISIIWDDTRYVDEEGEQHRVVHEGVKYSERNEPQPVTVVLQDETVFDYVFPSDHFRVDWPSVYERPLFEETHLADNPSRLQKKARTYVGKSVAVRLRLLVDETAGDYVFMFRIVDATVNR